MKLSANVSRWLKISLGLIFIIYGLNRFFHFIPWSYGQMPEEAERFIDAVVMYLPALYIFEILIGVLMVINKWTSFLLVVLFPLSISFLIFHFANRDFSEMWPALIVAGLNVVLLLDNREKYLPLFD